MSDKINLSDYNEPEENPEKAEEKEQSVPETIEDEFLFENGFSFADEEYDQPEAEEETQGTDKTERIKRIAVTAAWIVAILAISLSIAGGIIFAGADYLGVGFGRGNKVEITIPEGSTASDVADILKDEGVVKSKLLFRVFSKIKKYDAKYQSGTRVIDSDAGYSGVAEALTKPGVARKSIKVTILEGWNIDQIAAELEKNEVCTAKDFKNQIRDGEFDFDFIKEIPTDKVYYRLEGYLYPDTYDFLCYEEDGFSSSECAYYAIDKMLQNLDKKITPELQKKIDDSDYTLHQILTMASVVEQEAGKASQENRNKVARVFYNRIEGANWDGPRRLESDPTTYYPYGNGKYNTYKVIGLPVGPLCSPRIECIKAAITPAKDGKIVFFVTDSDGKFYFNENISGHNKTVATLKAQGKWIYTTLGDN